MPKEKEPLVPFSITQGIMPKALHSKGSNPVYEQLLTELKKRNVGEYHLTVPTLKDSTLFQELSRRMKDRTDLGFISLHRRKGTVWVKIDKE